MKYNPDIHHRRSIRLKGYDYSQASAYFVTICTQNKECLFGDIIDREMRLNDAGSMIRDIWHKIPEHFSDADIDTFVVMPNHVHGIIVVHAVPVGAIHELPLQNESPDENRKYRRQMLLPKIVGRFKMNTAKQINFIHNTPGYPLWQRNYYEHIIRNEKSLQEIREYIINNPLKWESDRNNPANIIHHCRGNS